MKRFIKLFVVGLSIAVTICVFSILACANDEAILAQVIESEGFTHAPSEPILGEFPTMRVDIDTNLEGISDISHWFAMTDGDQVRSMVAVPSSA